MSPRGMKSGFIFSQFDVVIALFGLSMSVVRSGCTDIFLMLKWNYACMHFILKCSSISEQSERQKKIWNCLHRGVNMQSK